MEKGAKAPFFIAQGAARVRYTRSEGAVGCALGDGVAILDSVNNNYFSLNSVGSFIWEALPQSPDEIVQGVIARYDVNPQTAAQDVAVLLSDLERAGLIRPELEPAL